MPRRISIALPGLLFALRDALFGSARAQDKPPPQRLVVIRDAETEALVHKFADPLFRAANLGAGLVRIVLLEDRAINAFLSTGNRMFIPGAGWAIRGRPTSPWPNRPC